ncbi:MAG: hypothetical protein AB2A00_07485 [Myxococcota bacterium]
MAASVVAALILGASCAQTGDSQEEKQDSGTPTSTKANVGSQGGSVSHGGASVEVPPGALGTDVEVTVAEVPFPAAALPADMTTTGSAFAFTPHGTTFTSPVTLELPHDGTADAVLRLDDENDSTWEIVDGATFANGVATVQTTRFSVYVTVSSCSRLCAHGATVCGAAGSAVTQGTCVSSCTSQAAQPNAACGSERQALYNCFTATTNAAEFACSTTLLPNATTCAAERATLQACADPCPCFNTALLQQSYDEARAASTLPGVGPRSTPPSEFGGCAYSPGGTFGDPNSVSSILFIAMEPPNGEREAYFGWFGVGPQNGTTMCFVWQGDSDPLDGPDEVGPLAVTPTQAAKCVDVLTAFRDQQSPAWTCFEQH